MTLDTGLQWSYALLVLLGIALLALFRPASQYSTPEKRSYYRIQAITFVGAILGAKIAVVFGDALWPLRPVEHWRGLLLSGRSIVGALLFGFLAAEIAKPLLGYRLPPNDRFAVALPFSIATGRLGCWFSGCCLGVPMHGGIALVAADGVARYPAALIESVFHVLAGAVLALLYRRALLRGHLFSLYLVAYGAFRFATEFLRVTPKAFWHLSAYQWLSLVMILAGAVCIRLRRTPPSTPSSGQLAAGAHA